MLAVWPMAAPASPMVMQKASSSRVRAMAFGQCWRGDAGPRLERVAGMLSRCAASLVAAGQLTEPASACPDLVAAVARSAAVHIPAAQTAAGRPLPCADQGTTLLHAALCVALRATQCNYSTAWTLLQCRPRSIESSPSRRHRHSPHSSALRHITAVHPPSVNQISHSHAAAPACCQPAVGPAARPVVVVAVAGDSRCAFRRESRPAVALLPPWRPVLLCPPARLVATYWAPAEPPVLLPGQSAAAGADPQPPS